MVSQLDPQAQALLNEWAKAPPIDIVSLTPTMVRESEKDVHQLQDPIEPVKSIKEYIASTPEGEIPITIYTPKNSRDDRPLPVFIYFHGGGFVIGGEGYEAPLRRLANQSQNIICAVQYSLAPEHKYPKAAREAVAATQWLVNNIASFNGNPNRIAVGGDSAGGNLASVVALENRNNKIHPFTSLILIYPMLDATCSQPSMEEFAHGYGFTKEKARWYLNQYLPKGIDRTKTDVSPLFAEQIEHFPSTFIASAEFDPLRDEAETFAQKLEAAGVDVSLERYLGTIHGFFQMAGILDQGKRLIEDVAKWLLP